MPLSEKPKQERINIFLPPDVISKLKEISETKGITVSALIRMVILEYLAK